MLATFLRRLSYFNNSHAREYELLSSTTTSSSSSLSSPTTSLPRRKKWRRVPRITPRRVVCVLLSIPVLLALGVLWSGVPPLYEDVRRYEKRLPQHAWGVLEKGRNETEGRGRGGDEGELYLRFPGHIWGHGFNNVLQEYLLTSYIAHESGRTFVFEDYTWSHLPLPYTIYDFALRNTRIPLNAFISGPTAGGSVSSSSSQPNTQGKEKHLAISASYYAQLCSSTEEEEIDAADAPKGADGVELVRWWRERLRGVNERGVRCGKGRRRVVDRYFFGSPRVLTLWPEFSKSPILREFKWSPLVTSAILRNFWLFSPQEPSSAPPQPREDVIPSLVAVHLRRGDYKRHCPRLYNWGLSYMGLNTFPGLLDTFDRTQFNVSYLKEYYLQHCLPTIPQLVQRLHEVREDNPTLKRVYVLSNAWPSFLNELKKELWKDGWGDVGDSYDLTLDSEQRGVAAAVDMGVAERAEVFLGNGFSSLSANIVMLRIAKGMRVSSNRFL
ncbi:hypothetical protein BDQ17DRAFT_1244641 [Cyathus striatus]|nr:hypothetical protein BDQ17DRAFT_1244641 [Cyathus striatus]